MGQFAYLAPVGPFAGLSNAARQQICERFPGVSPDEIETASASFLLELQAHEMEPRLAEARDELNNFARELARFRRALNEVRRHRLDHAIGEVSRMITGENEYEDLERSLGNLRTAVQQTSRALPPEGSQIASRRLIAALAKQVRKAGLPPGGRGMGSLVNLVDLVFEDLMVGGDAEGAVREWHQGEAGDIDQDRARTLFDLAPVPVCES